ncbi:MAG: hypothetical protein SOY32_07815, partial [Candidatus Faecousia sp.]|nr:hypothetical protein [Candidatus Faecousia sp.]
MENVNKLVGAFPVKMDELHKVCHMFAKLSGAGWAMRSHCLGTDCHVAALLAMTGSGAWWVWRELPSKFAGARRGLAPAARFRDATHPIQTRRTPKSVIAN